MLPHSYALAAAVLLVLGGALSCFAGYRLFKITLAIYGLILGAMVASTAMGAASPTGMVVAAIVGGIVGAVVLVFAYFLGIALVGAGLGALVAHFAWSAMRTGDPPAALVIALSILGAVGAMLLQRYVIVVATAFGGAWTLLLGVLTLASPHAERASRLGDVWILYPTTPAPGAPWIPIAWIVLGLAGTAMQLSVTGRNR